MGKKEAKMVEGNEMRSDSIVANKSYLFALEIVKIYKQLAEKKEFVLSKQLLRAGTSIGANIHEALSGQTKRDFVYKLNIALKESRETQYWLKLLKDSDYISTIEFDKLNSGCTELLKMLTSIIITTKQRYFPKNNPNLNSKP